MDYSAPGDRLDETNSGAKKNEKNLVSSLCHVPSSCLFCRLYDWAEFHYKPRGILKYGAGDFYICPYRISTADVHLVCALH